MKIKLIKPILSVLLCSLLLGSLKVPAEAHTPQKSEVLSANSIVEISDITLEPLALLDGSARATNRFDWSISPGVTKQATTAFSLSANEKVTFNCTFTPTNASVDFGLISPNGTFYHISAGNGTIKDSVQVPENAKYYLAIRNNSKSTVQVMGFVSY